MMLATKKDQKLSKEYKHLIVEDVSCQKQFPAELVDYREDGTIIFTIVGEKATNTPYELLTVDTLYEKGWKIIKTW